MGDPPGDDFNTKVSVFEKPFHFASTHGQIELDRALRQLEQLGDLTNVDKAFRLEGNSRNLARQFSKLIDLAEGFSEQARVIQSLEEAFLAWLPVLRHAADRWHLPQDQTRRSLRHLCELTHHLCLALYNQAGSNKDRP